MARVVRAFSYHVHVEPELVDRGHFALRLLVVAAGDQKVILPRRR
jgi:hypothetical protein